MSLLFLSFLQGGCVFDDKFAITEQTWNHYTMRLKAQLPFYGVSPFFSSSTAFWIYCGNLNKKKTHNFYDEETF